MPLPQPGAEAEHELDALELVEPILERRADLVGVRAADAGRASGAQELQSQRAVAVQGAVTVDAAELEVLGEEQRHRHAVAAVEAELAGERLALVAVAEAQVDLRRVGLGDA